MAAPHHYGKFERGQVVEHFRGLNLQGRERRDQPGVGPLNVLCRAALTSQDEPNLHRQLRVGVSQLRDEGGVIEWLTGFDESTLSDHLAAGTTFEGFFSVARLNPHASLITGVMCGVRVEEVDDPLIR